MSTIYRNKKNQQYYEVIGEAINCTNEQDGQQMIIYKSFNNPELTFVRERDEFLFKFEETEE